MSNSISSKETICALMPGQNVQTSFGPGTVSAISLVDSLVYVALARQPKALYVFKPEQVKQAA
ncbi:MAG: hypothetical protein HY231_17375 [Acidobacteria bacterium]|nr:hypothetical protein [Acidobacteriota bacterium]